MRVGLVYDLRDDYLAEGWPEDLTAEFDRADTIDALEGAIRALGHEVDRVGRATALMERLLRGDRWDVVFSISEGVAGFGRESLVPALLDHFGVPYVFSDPLVCAMTLHKGAAKHVMRDHGVPTPDFVVLERAEDARSVRLPFPLFAKPVAEGSSKGVELRSKAKSHAELESACASLIERFRQPAIVETFLPGREFTVGVVGTGAEATAVGVMEVALTASAEPEIYSYTNKEEWEGRVEYTLAGGAIAREAEAVALAAWRALGCRDGGRVDVRADASGRLNVLEINPLPGLSPKRSDLPIMCRLGGMPFEELIGRIMASALRRTAPRQAGAPCAR
jgi:D-alanine-D-alanine ligase